MNVSFSWPTVPILRRWNAKLTETKSFPFVCAILSSTKTTTAHCAHAASKVVKLENEEENLHWRCDFHIRLRTHHFISFLFLMKIWNSLWSSLFRRFLTSCGERREKKKNFDWPAEQTAGEQVFWPFHFRVRDFFHGQLRYESMKPIIHATAVGWKNGKLSIEFECFLKSTEISSLVI